MKKLFQKFRQLPKEERHNAIGLAIVLLLDIGLLMSVLIFGDRSLRISIGVFAWPFFNLVFILTMARHWVERKADQFISFIDRKLVGPQA